MKLVSDFTPEDYIELDRLWREYWQEFSLPNRNSKIVDAIAKNDEGRIIGYGQVRVFAELMLFLDPTARKRDRARSTKLLMQEAFRGVDVAGLEDVYAFIRDPDFAMLIAKRYGFVRRVQPGELLARSL